jgi:hypothetical protein
MTIKLLTLLSRNAGSFLHKLKYTWLMIFCIAFTSHAQNVIRGTVLDEANQPVVGATVAIRAAGAGAVTDADGKFSISTSKALPLTLTISYLGFKPQEITAASAQEPLSIRLAESTNQLDETVVVGYTTSKRSSYTGSVAVVNAKDIETLQITTVGKALQGTVPGLQSIASAGQPGADADLYVRGVGSVNASTAPLYVVDGIPGAMPTISIPGIFSPYRF